MNQSVAKKSQQEGGVAQRRMNMLDAQLQPVLPRFIRRKVPNSAQINAQELHDKLAKRVDASIRVSRMNYGFDDLERLCEEVIAEGNFATITGFIIAERGEGDCVQFCCLVDGLPGRFHYNGIWPQSATDLK